MPGGEADPSGREAAFGLDRFFAPFRPDAVPLEAFKAPFRFDWAKLLPAATLYLHVHRDTLHTGAGGVVRWEDEEPVTWQYVTEHIAPYHRFVIKPVLDLATQAPVDAYEVPDRHREAVHLLNPADVFPYGTNTTRGMQIDHTEPYRFKNDSDSRDSGGDGEGSGGGGSDGGRGDWTPGQSRIGNYGPLTREHHRIKTFGCWEVKQPFPGIHLWRDPHGRLYLSDHTGTRRATTRTVASSHSNGHRTDLAIELYPSPYTVEVTDDIASAG